MRRANAKREGFNVARNNVKEEDTARSCTKIEVKVEDQTYRHAS